MGALKIVTENNELKEPKFNYKAELLKLVPNTDIVDDYIAVGKTMKRTPTKTGLNLFKNECDKHNLSYELAMIIVIDKGWRGFNYLWLKEEDFVKYNIKKRTPPEPKKQKNEVTMEQIKDTLSVEEKIFKDKQVINTSFADYIDFNKPIDLPSIKFDSLVEYGIIKIPKENTPELHKYYDAKRKEAITLLKEKYNIENANSLHHKRALQDINKLLDNGSLPEIITKTKEIVLINYFDKMLKDGKTKIFEL